MNEAIDYSRLNRTDYAPVRMRKLFVAIVGLGALGNEVVRSLALLGAGRVVLIDRDTIHPSNATRSFFFREAVNYGRRKCDVIAEALQTGFPDTVASSKYADIADLGYGDLEGVHLIFSCVDNDAARLDLAYISTQTGIPVCDGGLASPNCAQGRVSYFADARACYSCLLPTSSRSALLTSAHSAGQSCSTAPWDEDTERPSTPTMAAIIGAMQVELGLRSLAGVTDVSYSLNVALAPQFRMERILHSIAPDCPMHESRQPRIRAHHSITACEILRQCGDGARLILDAPVCAAARCRTCGHHWKPMARLRTVRSSGACPACGGSSIAVIDVIHSVGEGSAWARRSLRDLGQPEDHTYLVIRQGV